MPEAFVPKNGIPAFDASGNISMIPRSNVDSPFGFSKKTISVQEVPGGGYGYLLLADAGQYPLMNTITPTGFSGLAFKNNNGYIRYYGMALVNASVSYNASGTNGSRLTTTADSFIPVVVKYNGHAYVGLKYAGNTGSVTLYGLFNNCLKTPIIVNNRDGKNIDELEIMMVAETPAISGGNYLFVKSLRSLAERRAA